MMQNTTHGLMGGYGGVGMVLGALLAIPRVVAIVKMLGKN
jgi:hypothetical protein